jgi:hypothetical protein
MYARMWHAGMPCDPYAHLLLTCRPLKPVPLRQKLQGHEQPECQVQAVTLLLAGGGRQDAFQPLPSQLHRGDGQVP